MTRKERGALIREARALIGWTVADLAGRIGISEQSVSLAERGDAAWPAGSQVKAISALIDEFSDRRGVPRIRPKLTPCGASRLLSVIVARSGAGA